ncbi:MAG: rhomboid family intramembrane serine protease [Flavobacteriaceae bacterium]
MKSHLYQTYRFLFLPFIALLAIWLVYWIEIRFGLNFNRYGLVPRSFKGLRGLLFSPFIHSGFEHLLKNSIPLVILSSALAFFYPKRHLHILLYGFIFSGVLAWIIGRPSYHIGASGIVYFLASFLFFNGIKSRNFRLIALALGVVFVYGSLVWGVLPDETRENVSWEGHLSGLIVGFLMSYFYISQFVFKSAKKKPKTLRQSQHEEEFMRQFDANGNFDPIDPEAIAPEPGQTSLSSDDNEVHIYYKSKRP